MSTEVSVHCPECLRHVGEGDPRHTIKVDWLANHLTAQVEECREPGTVITNPLPRLPQCDLCETVGVKHAAEYDAKTRLGPWAYLCRDHFDRVGPGRLGTGFGQKLWVAT